MSLETILKDLQRAVAALEQLDKQAVADDNRLVFIADQLRAHANRLAPWTQCYPLMPLYVGNVVEEVLKRWRSPPGTKIMEIVQRACAVVSERVRERGVISYRDTLDQVCDFVETYALGAGIELVAKKPRD
jgi:hypothetical protein